VTRAHQLDEATAPMTRPCTGGSLRPRYSLNESDATTPADLRSAATRLTGRADAERGVRLTWGHAEPAGLLWPRYEARGRAITPLSEASYHLPHTHVRVWVGVGASLPSLAPLPAWMGPRWRRQEDYEAGSLPSSHRGDKRLAMLPTALMGAWCSSSSGQGQAEPSATPPPHLHSQPPLHGQLAPCCHFCLPPFFTSHTRSPRPLSIVQKNRPCSPPRSSLLPLLSHTHTHMRRRRSLLLLRSSPSVRIYTSSYAHHALPSE